MPVWEWGAVQTGCCVLCMPTKCRQIIAGLPFFARTIIRPSSWFQPMTCTKNCAQCAMTICIPHTFLLNANNVLYSCTAHLYCTYVQCGWAHRRTIYSHLNVYGTHRHTKPTESAAWLSKSVIVRLYVCRCVHTRSTSLLACLFVLVCWLCDKVAFRPHNNTIVHTPAFSYRHAARRCLSMKWPHVCFFFLVFSFACHASEHMVYIFYYKCAHDDLICRSFAHIVRAFSANCTDQCALGRVHLHKFINASPTAFRKKYRLHSDRADSGAFVWF